MNYVSPDTFVWRLLLALLLSVPAGARAQLTRPPEDSLQAMLSRLNAALVGVDGLADSTVGALRVDSGTIRCDSQFLRFRDSLQRRIDGVAHSTTDSRLFRATIWPYGPPRIRDSVVQLLLSHGIHAGVEWGNPRMSVDLARFLAATRPFLTGEMRTYVDLTLDEQRRPCCRNASLMISWSELGNRVAGYDRFTTNYPNAGAAAEAEAEFQVLFGLFLTGSDSTPAFSGPGKPMSQMVLETLTRYATAHRELRSGQVVADYLSLLNANNYEETPAVTRFLRAHQVR